MTSMKSGISFIYFDIGGVFLNWVQGFRNVSAKYNIAVSDIEVVVKKHWDYVVRGGETDAYMRDLASLIRLPEPYPEVTDFWSDFHTPITESHEFAAELSRTYRLGIITNAEKNAYHYATRKRLVPQISWEVVVDSSVVGYAKPEPRIYEIAEQRVGVRPQELLFIDDVPEHIEAVRARGWQGVVYDTDNPKKSINEIRRRLQGDSS